MDRWAFATSPDGLGLTSQFFWSITHRELRAYRKVWDAKQKQHRNEFAEFRADLYRTSDRQRNDGHDWSREHFGGDPYPPAPRLTREQLRAKAKAACGPDGKRFVKTPKPKKGEKYISIVSTLKGQPLPRKAG